MQGSTYRSFPNVVLDTKQYYARKLTSPKLPVLQVSKVLMAEISLLESDQLPKTDRYAPLFIGVNAVLGGYSSAKLLAKLVNRLWARTPFPLSQAMRPSNTLAHRQ